MFSVISMHVNSCNVCQQIYYYYYSNIVQSDLAKSGFVAHPTKSQWIPKQEGEHLGFIVNLKDGVFSVPARRLLVLQKKIGETGTRGKTHSQNTGQFSGYSNFHLVAITPKENRINTVSFTDLQRSSLGCICYTEISRIFVW